MPDEYLWVWESAQANGDETFVLKSCPPGHQLVNSTEVGGAFNPSLQKCSACAANEYILDQFRECQVVYVCPPFPPPAPPLLVCA